MASVNIDTSTASITAQTITANVTGQVSDISNHTTTELSEGTNKYYTDTRARAAISGSTGITYNASTGQIAIAQDVATTANVQFQDVYQTRRNYIGAIRNSTTNTNGDVWSYGAGTGTAFRGYSVDNSANTAKRPGYFVRSYSGGASTPRTDFMYESARNTAASPSKLLAGDYIGEIHATGYTDAGWIGDLVAAAPAGNTYYATESWTGISNCGAGWIIQLQPTATTLTSGGLSRTTVMDTRPEGLTMRGDSYALGAGKTAAFTATGCSTSGTTLTIGTLTSGSIAVGQLVQTSLQGLLTCYIVANISGSGNGSTWQLSQTQSTLSALTITGNKGAIGFAPGINTVDMLAPVKFPSYTTTQRDAMTAQPGMTLYNSTTSKLQCYNGVGWQDLF